MKKVILLAVLLFACLIPASYAAPPAKNFVLLDDKSNHSFIPLRSLNGMDGIKTGWTPAEKRIDLIRGETQLTMHLGKTQAIRNDKSIKLSDAPFTEGGITFVPLQTIKDSFPVSLEWSKDTASLTIHSKASEASTENLLTTSLPYITKAAYGKQDKPIISERKTFKVGSKSYNTQMVTISLLHPKVSLDVVLAGDEAGNVEELSSIAKRSKATVAINGTFFDAYTTGSYKGPYGYIISGGSIAHKSSGDRRTVFTFDHNLLAELIPGADFPTRFAEGDIQGGLQAGPRLIVNGKVALNVVEEGFKDPKILTGGGARSALGITRDHKLILLTTGGATIPQLAEMMKQAGAYQAMNLDGGASSGLYYNGKYLTTPGRKISNALVVKVQ
ncbi:phosphodiester glycosidase family protein [Paenibacillus sp. GM2]|uniref:phosphodiester glycosidase family protein n=1 Tax=Paenibacillus sp. GM2 TaxID=1622070 RepID=UPI000839B888|nr:phosphodiester glycosidase family protein [Paenibacillus sp. GM2]